MNLRPTLIAGILAWFIAGCVAPDAQLLDTNSATLSDVKETSATPSDEAQENEPVVKSFTSLQLAPIAQNNSQLAKDFMDLGFQLENGRIIPVLARFAGTIEVDVTAPVSDFFEAELDSLLNRLRREARIDIIRAENKQSPKR